MDSSGEKGLEDLENQLAVIRKVGAGRKKELKELQEHILKKTRLRDELEMRVDELQQQLVVAKLKLAIGKVKLKKLRETVKEKHAKNTGTTNKIAKTEIEIKTLTNKIEAKTLEMEQEATYRQSFIKRVEAIESKRPERVELARLCDTLKSLKETETAINTEGTLENQISSGKALEDVQKEKEEFLATLERIAEEKQFFENKLCDSKLEKDAIMHEIRSLEDRYDPDPSALERQLQQLLDEENELEKYLAVVHTEKGINEERLFRDSEGFDADNEDN